MRFVIIGGSASATPELADALADWPGGAERRPALELVLYARSAQRLQTVAAEVARRSADLAGAPVQVRAETDLDAALAGADVVLNSIRVGGLAARSFDESFPHAFGLPGEETMGPGGFANALRSVPVSTGLWSRVAEIAPDALCVNLTNPSGIVVTAVRRQLGLEVVSVCDSPITFCDSIADRVGRPVDEVRAAYQGMNHLGWWLPAGERELEATLDLAKGQAADAVRVQAAIGAPYVRYYVHPARLLEAQTEAGETRAQQLQRLEADLLAGYADGADDLPKRGAVWYATAVLPLIDAWTNGSPETLILGLPNEGRVAGLPDDVITEGPVRISQPGRIAPLPHPALPAVPASMLQANAAYESQAASAAGPKADHEQRVRALMLNPMVPSYDLAEGLVGHIETHSPS